MKRQVDVKKEKLLLITYTRMNCIVKGDARKETLTDLNYFRSTYQSMEHSYKRFCEVYNEGVRIAGGRQPGRYYP